jgi:hypothetical protein
MRGCGRNERPAFPAPSFTRDKVFVITRACSCRGKAAVCLRIAKLEEPIVLGYASSSPAKAGDTVFKNIEG